MSEHAKAVPPTIGKIIPLDEPAARDAIHIAIAPLVAGERLWRGTEVGLDAQGKVVGSSDEYGNDRANWKAIGIVDPYLDGNVYPEQRVWVFLFPNTVTSLRHQWTHPDFKDEPTPVLVEAPRPEAENESKKWMRQFAYDCGIDYDTALQAGRDQLAGGYGYTFPYDTPEAVYKGQEEYWRHFRAITKEKVSGKDAEQMPFSCSC